MAHYVSNPFIESVSVIYHQYCKNQTTTKLALNQLHQNFFLSTVINCNERFSKESLKTNTFYNIDGPDGPEEHSSNVFSALESSVITLGLTQHLPDLLLLLLCTSPRPQKKSTLLISNICPI